MKVVLDPFMGSGITDIASIMSHRFYLGYEINENTLGFLRRE
ncbi:MAG: site-specific DNA-methyltransferase [Candidatus Calescibacterium sp.]|nr:site-specific DNA-methyltransferase [Candidatus Calescibacterium sp.]MCX7733939.1 site-specific DNA-methyltransferase [bacterium]MDW8086463.1 DNA methyltransferase [Candidatus Calescibacterium sp.]